MTLKVPKQSLHKTSWLKMMYRNTKFDYKKFNSSEDIVQKNITQSFEPLLWQWPWTQQFFSQDIPACDNYLPSNKV